MIDSKTRSFHRLAAAAARVDSSAVEVRYPSSTLPTAQPASDTTPSAEEDHAATARDLMSTTLHSTDPGQERIVSRRFPKSAAYRPCLCRMRSTEWAVFGIRCEKRSKPERLSTRPVSDASHP